MKTSEIIFENRTFLGIFIEVPEGGYSAYIDKISGVNTQGETFKEAEKNLKDALRLVLESAQSF